MTKFAMSLGNQPGAIAFTLIPCRAHFHARSRVKRDHAALRRVVRQRVRTSAGAPCRPGDRRDVDDLAAALLDHRPAHRLRAQEDAVSVHVDDLSATP
jgi:hypothetical protein